MNAKNVLNYAAEQGAKFVSVRFTDLVGAWHHLTYPIEQLTEDSFEEGFGFDASSLRGWAAINESDMLLVPDAGRFWVDPFTEEETICLIASVVEPITKEGYGLDPRSFNLLFCLKKNTGWFAPFFTRKFQRDFTTVNHNFKTIFLILRLSQNGENLTKL